MELTLLYYTANLISDFFANNVRSHLLKTGNGYPIISVSQKPIDFGENICVNLKPSIYNIYKQILIGAKEAKTEYIACCEDDSLYVPEHFQHRPSSKMFSYNVNRWHVNKTSYFFRHRRGMCMCIAPTQLLIDTLETRFSKYPELIAHFGEPGRYEKQMGLPYVKTEMFKTKTPTLHFTHHKSMGGVRKVLPKDQVISELPEWGRAKELWEAIHG